MIRTFLLSVLLVVIVAPFAYAHARLESSTPAANAVLDASPASIAITFSEEVRPKETVITLLNAQKKRIKTAALTVAKNPETVSVVLPALAPGIYTVRWKAVCMCTDHHATYGSYRFTVQ